MLTGGHDIDPMLYGEEPSPQCGPICRERDAMETITARSAMERDLPILGICRGIQFLNVFLGGSLYQDLPAQHPSETEHHQRPPYDVPAHRVSLSEGGSLFQLLQKASIPVNSYHHQAIKRLGSGLRVMAVSEDGIPEAVELPEKRFVWAVQWHPEFSYPTDESSKRIFREFVRKCSGG